MTEYLEKQIAARRSRLASLEKERATLIAELTAYEDALANAADGAGQITLPASHRHQRQLLPVSSAWRSILQQLAGFKHFNASDVKLIAQKLHSDGTLRKPQTSDGVRAQLSLYAKKQIVKRLGGGNYRLTERTKTALGLRSFAVGEVVGENSVSSLKTSRASGDGVTSYDSRGDARQLIGEDRV